MTSRHVPSILAAEKRSVDDVAFAKINASSQLGWDGESELRFHGCERHGGLA